VSSSCIGDVNPSFGGFVSSFSRPQPKYNRTSYGHRAAPRADRMLNDAFFVMPATSAASRKTPRNYNYLQSCTGLFMFIIFIELYACVFFCNRPYRQIDQHYSSDVYIHVGTWSL